MKARLKAEELVILMEFFVAARLVVYRVEKLVDERVDVLDSSKVASKASCLVALMVALKDVLKGLPRVVQLDDVMAVWKELLMDGDVVAKLVVQMEKDLVGTAAVD